MQENIFDPVDSRLLNLIQADIPLTESPWLRLGEKAGLTEEETLRRVARLKNAGVIRRLGGVFDSHRLGYAGTLCAFRVPAERVRDVAAVINSYPGVTHNYLRRHEYNMWFTLLAPSKAELEHLAEEIRLRAGVSDWLNLPAKRYFKVRVHFPVGATKYDINDAEGENNNTESLKYNTKHENRSPLSFTAAEKRLITALQEGLPLVERPYAALTNGLGWSEREALDAFALWRAEGVLKRVAAILRQRRAGYGANALVLWRVPAHEAESAGFRLAARPEVTHCYERETLPSWPYNIYTMLHSKTEDECRALARELADLAGGAAHELLFSTEELKKSSMRYFVRPSV
jgi:DNA-binding Lrp family transcriptional regulator